MLCSPLLRLTQWRVDGACVQCPCSLCIAKQIPGQVPRVHRHSLSSHRRICGGALPPTRPGVSVSQEGRRVHIEHGTRPWTLFLFRTRPDVLRSAATRFLSRPFIQCTSPRVVRKARIPPWYVGQGAGGGVPARKPTPPPVGARSRGCVMCERERRAVRRAEKSGDGRAPRPRSTHPRSHPLEGSSRRPASGSGV